MLNTPAIARIAYAALAELRLMQGHPYVPWGVASESERNVALGSVAFLVDNPEAGEDALFDGLTLNEGVPPYGEAPEEVRLMFAIVVSITRGILQCQD